MSAATLATLATLATPYSLTRKHRVAVDRLRELAFIFRDPKYGSFPDHQFVLDMAGYNESHVGPMAEAGALFGSKFTRLRKGCKSALDHAAVANLSHAQSFFCLSFPQVRYLFTSGTEDSVLPAHTERYALARHIFSFVADVETGRAMLL